MNRENEDLGLIRRLLESYDQKPLLNTLMASVLETGVVKPSTAG